MAQPMHPATTSPLSTAPHPEPFALAPCLFEKVWGGQRLARLGKSLPDPEARYGESWELADMPSTSPAGAGGGAVRTLIATGPLTGLALRDAVQTWGSALLGERPPTPGGDFPLLVKFLDACENLSVQVHPSPGYAAAHPGSHLKTECWYIVDADPGSVIYKGLRPGVSREAFAARCRANDPALVKDLAPVPAIPGECHNLPSGTVHALGAGVLVAEVQTPSDTTYRLFDWGRKGRELHVEQSLACALAADPPAATRIAPDGSRTRLVTMEFFTLDGLELARARAAPVADGARPRCAVVILLAGRLRLASAGGSLAMEPGTTVVVPGGCAGAQLHADDPARVLIATL
jgi:mannose-6-phosphate isomerase